jgi:hypothetical protein
MLDHTGPVWCKTIDYLPQEAIELLPWPAMSPVLNPRIFMGLFRTKMHVPQSVKRFRNGWKMKTNQFSTFIIQLITSITV